MGQAQGPGPDGAILGLELKRGLTHSTTIASP